MQHRVSQLGWVVLIAAFGLIWSSSATASVVLQLSDQQMTLRADRIVRAKVTKKVSQWEPKTKRIYTYITLVVMDPIKGSQGSQEIQIRQMGGVANGVGMYVPGSAKFNLGEEILVFLEKIKKTQFHHVLGMSYGKFQVVTHPKSKVQTLVRQLKGISLATRNAQGRLQLQHGHKVAEQAKPLLLDGYINKLRGYLREAAKLKKLPKRPAVPQVRPTAPIKKIAPRKATPIAPQK